MRGICSLGLERSGLKALLAFCQAGKFVPFSEIELNISHTNFLDAIKESICPLEEEIRMKEKKHSVDIEKIYCRLPLNLSKVKVVEDIIPFSPRRKKVITPGTISKAKNYIEDAALEWDEICLHNLILEYQIDGKRYFNLPPGLEGRKLKLKVFLVYMERKLLKEVEEIFENITRKFMGFVFAPFADISANFKKEFFNSPYGVVRIDEENTLCSAMVRNRIYYESFDFGERKLKKKMEKTFSFSPEVCSEIMDRYISFKSGYLSKEVVIKEGGDYYNLSMESLTSFMRGEFSKELKAVLDFFKGVSEEKFKILFLGRLTLTTGFSDFLREKFPFLELTSPSFKIASLSLLGCIKYGQHRFLERSYLFKINWWERILRIYKDYF